MANIQPPFKKSQAWEVLGLLVCYSPYSYKSFLNFSASPYLVEGLPQNMTKRPGLYSAQGGHSTWSSRVAVARMSVLSLIYF